MEELYLRLIWNEKIENNFYSTIIYLESPILRIRIIFTGISGANKLKGARNHLHNINMIQVWRKLMVTFGFCQPFLG